MFGKYKDPEPIYDPIQHKQLYSDHHIRFDHDLEKYQMNKQTKKGKCFQTNLLILWWPRNILTFLNLNIRLKSFLFTQTKLLRLTTMRDIQEVLESKEGLSLTTIKEVNWFIYV